MNNNILNILLPTSIGEINNIKINKLGEKLGRKYPSGESDGVNRVIFYNNDRTKTIEINNNSIIASIYSPTELTNDHLVSIHEDLLIITETLMINSNFKNVSVQNSCNYKIAEDSMSLTKGLVSNTLNFKCLDDCIGAGFRFLYKNKQGLLDEFKFEPFLSDNKFIFSEGIYNYINLSLDTLVNDLKNNLDDFRIRFNDILSNIK